MRRIATAVGRTRRHAGWTVDHLHGGEVSNRSRDERDGAKAPPRRGLRRSRFQRRRLARRWRRAFFAFLAFVAFAARGVDEARPITTACGATVSLTVAPASAVPPAAPCAGV